MALVLASCGQTADRPPAREDIPRAEIDQDWPHIPDNAVFGQISAVEIDSHGHIFVLHRAGREWIEPFPSEPIPDPTVFMFDTEGKLIARWGANSFVMPHGISVDEQDRVWITDVGHEQVFRFSHDGELELTLGERGASAQDAQHFGRPADVAFLGKRVLVADGYVNTRVAEFDEDGVFLRDWGDFNVAHAIAVDDERVFVADRESARIGVFSHEGRPIADWTSDRGNHTYGLAPLGNGMVLAIEGRDGADRTGAILRIYRPDGSIERSFDVGLPEEDASLGHDVAVGADGLAYITDVYGGRVFRLRIPLKRDGTR